MLENNKENSREFQTLNVTLCELNFKEKQEDKTYSLDEAVNNVGFGRFQYTLLFITGLGWVADAIEVYILSVLGPILACTWNLYEWQLAVLTTGVFLGMMIGSPILGKLADKYGRRMSLGIGIVMTTICGMASAASSTYYWMLVFRTLVGFGLSGIPQGLTLCCEFIPTKIRGKAGFYLCYFWSAGTIGVVLISWLIMEQINNWRVLLVVAALPGLIALLSIKWLNESARYYMVSGKPETAQKVIDDMAKTNRKNLPLGNLQILNQCEDRGSFLQLFSAEFIKSTLLLCYLTFATAFSYYGVTFVSPYIVKSSSIKNIPSEMGTNNTSGHDFYMNIMPCKPLSREDYINLLWTSAAELPGIFLFTILIERFERKHFLCITCLISSILTFLLLLEIKQKFVLLIFLFGARGLLVAIFQMSYVMISESFPTTLRATALGLGATFAKIGGLINSYISQMLIFTQPVISICIIGGVVLLASLVSMCLPLETRGIKLTESHSNDDKTKKDQS